jgi:hypothetical protein
MCPLIKKPCIKHECDWYVQLFGAHPQTGEKLSEFKCTFSWLPILLIEGAKESRQTAAAVESFRNEVAAQQVRQELTTPLLTDAVDPEL